MRWRKHTCFRCGRVAEDLVESWGDWGFERWSCSPRDEDVYAECGRITRELKAKRHESAIRLRLIFEGKLKPGEPLPPVYKGGPPHGLKPE